MKRRIIKSILGLAIILLSGFYIGVLYYTANTLVLVGAFTVWWYAAIYWLTDFSVLWFR